MTDLHIVAFNAEKYRDIIAERFPDLTIHTAASRQDMDPSIEEADFIIAFGTQTYDELFARNTNLKWIQALGTGVDGIADQPSLRKDVIVTSMRGIHGPQMSEMALLFMLALNRRFPDMVHNQKAHEWVRRPGLILEGKTVAILGIGIIAEALAKRCVAFDMEVLGISSTPRKLENFKRVYDRDDINEAVGQADYFVVLVPYSAATDKLVGVSVLAAMKPEAFLVNLARGGVVDEDALLDTLRAGKIAGAGLDVFINEPLSPDHPFWELDNVILTPHQAGMSEAYVRQAMVVIDHNLKAVLSGDTANMINLVEH